MNNSCLVYPALQKFYSALINIEDINCDKYIWETIPKIDSFFSEMRNITFVMQKSFNTPETSEVYTRLKDTFLNNDTMKWFKDKRNETTKEHPFRLEKAVDIEYYLPNFSIKAVKDRITIDNDNNFSDLYNKLKHFLDKYFSESVEVFLSTKITFLENEKEIDIFPIIISGINIMYSFLISVIAELPCNCKKCEKLQEEIKKLIDTTRAKQITFACDLYYTENSLSIGSSVHTIWSKENDINITKPITLKNSFLDRSNSLNCDISLLRTSAIFHISIARQQRSQSPNSELMPTFFLIYKDNTFSIYGPITGTNKSTFYRAISNICKVINNSDEVRAVLIISEGYFYVNTNVDKLCDMKYEDRIKEASGVMIMNTLISNKIDSVYSIEIDYKHLFDDKYIGEQIKEFVKYEPQKQVAYPIFQALHSQV